MEFIYHKHRGINLMSGHTPSTTALYNNKLIFGAGLQYPGDLLRTQKKERIIEAYLVLF